MRKLFVFPVILIFIQAAFSQGKAPDKRLLDKALSIHQKVITIDTHVDINPLNFTKERNYTMDLNTQVNLPKMRRGGLDVAWFIVYTGQGPLNKKGYEKAYKEAMEKFEAIHRLTEEIAPDQIELAVTPEQVRKIHAKGKLVAMIGVENAYSLGTDLGNFRKFRDLGARYISLAHQGHSQYSDSNTGEKDNQWLYGNGLSELGKKAVVEMNKLGIMIDVSHPSRGAFMDIIKRTKAPIIASHSSARALCNHSRNLDDEQLKLLKKNGGVVQAVAFGGYLNIEKNKAYRDAQNAILEKVAKEQGFKILSWEERSKLSPEKLRAFNERFDRIKKIAAPQLRKAAKKYPPVDVSDFVDHIDYMVKLIGIDHVGISSDFDGGGGIEGWRNAAESFNVTYELVKRGYSEADIAKLWGENLLRVLGEVENIGRELNK